MSIERYGQMPLWNPYHCGGVTAVGNPETQYFSPIFAFALIFGPTLGSKLMFAIHVLLGLFGFTVLSRRVFDLSWLASIVGASLWSCSGFFAQHFAAGHITFVSFAFAPAVLFTWRQALHNPRWCLGVAALLALTVFHGGTYPPVYLSLLLGLDALGLVFLERTVSLKRVILTGVFSGTFALGLASARLVPIADTLLRVPRQVPSHDSIDWAGMIAMFTQRSFPPGHPPYEHHWHEYAHYIGWPALLLAAVGLIVALRTKRFGFALGIAVFGMLCFGDFGAVSPWRWLHQLPVFDSMRVPSRFSVMLGLYLVLCTACAIDSIDRWLKRVGRGPIVQTALSTMFVIAVVAMGGEAFATNVRHTNVFHHPPIREIPSERFHLVRAASFSSYYPMYASLPQRNQGTPGCYPWGMPWPVSDRLWTGDQNQMRFSGTTGTIHGHKRTDHTWQVDLTTERPGLLVFNHNWDSGWISNTHPIRKHHGLLAVQVSEGTHNVFVRYSPRPFWIGLAVSFATMVLGLLLLVFGGRLNSFTIMGSHLRGWGRDRAP